MTSKPLAAKKTHSDAVHKISLLLGLGLLVALAMGQLTPPAVTPASAPAGQFSAERALADLQVIASQPHPTGSPAALAVESYLVRQLTAMGLQPEVQVTTAVQVKPDFESVWSGAVRNIVVRIPGVSNSGAVLLSAHYDSVPTGPGASDCGACAATLLETARALKASLPLKNDVILVFNNAEEHEMMGSHAYVTEHPWAKDAAVAINFEAQGSRGPAFMYASSRQTGWLVDALAQPAAHPLGYSFLNSMIGILAERAGSDMEEFTAVGSAGVSFVYAWNTPAYHNALDNVQAIDPRSLQQDGLAALTLTRQFGDMDLTLIPPGEAVFFNILPGVMVHYPADWSLPLACFVLVLLAGVLVRGLRNKRLTVRGLLGGLAAFIALLVVTLAASSLAWWGIKSLNGNSHAFMVGVYHSELMVVGMVLLDLALVSGLYALALHRLRLSNLWAGVLLGFAALMLWTSLAMPSGSYLFTWPTLAGLLGLAWLVSGDLLPLTWGKVAALLLVALPGFVLFLPLANLLLSLTSRAEALSRLPLIGLPVIFVSLLFTLLFPHLAIIQGTRKWMLPGVALAGCVLALAAGLRLSGFSPSQPKPDMATYRLEADSGQAFWYSVDETLDGYTGQFFSGQVEKSSLAPFPSESPATLLPAWKAPAPAAELPAPEITLLDVSTAGAARTYRFQVRSPRQALNMEVEVQAEGEISTGSVNGKPFDLSEMPDRQADFLRLQYYGLAPGGFELDLTVRSGEPLHVTLEDRSFSLPDFGTTFTPRPPATMPEIYEISDATLVRKTYTFP